MFPGDVLRDWFEAHRSGHLDAARGLMTEDATVAVEGQLLHGFDEFMDWYEQRRATTPEFSYEVMDLLSGDHHAAAVLSLRSGEETWRQLALYDVRDGKISAVWLVEDR